MKKTLPFIILWIIFALFMFWDLFIISPVKMWTILEVIAIALSIYLLIRNKFPSVNYVLISVIFMIICTVSYLGYEHNIGVIIYGLRAGISTLFCSFAVFSVMEKYGKFVLIDKKSKRSPLFSILIGLGTGCVLAVINSVLSNQTMNFDITFSRILVCFIPAIFEEMACRAIFMAFCIYASREHKMNRFQIFTMYFMMSMPHSAAHGYDLVSTVLLCIIFGLPFALLQKKRDITSAMISHGLVDAVRFTLFGL